MWRLFNAVNIKTSLKKILHIIVQYGIIKQHGTFRGMFHIIIYRYYLIILPEELLNFEN